MSWFDQAIKDYEREHIPAKFISTATMSDNCCLDIHAYELLNRVDKVRANRPNHKRHSIQLNGIARHECSLKEFMKQYPRSAEDKVDFGFQISERIDLILDMIRGRTLELLFGDAMVIVISIDRIPLANKNFQGKISRFTGFYRPIGEELKVFHFSDYVGDSWKKNEKIAQN